MKTIKTRIKIFKNKFTKKLSKEDLLKYRNILKLLYHKKAHTPLIDNKEKGRYFIQVHPINMYLIIDSNKCELINSERIYNLELPEEVYDRAVKQISEEITRQRIKLEAKLKYKKQNILEMLFENIK
jgi:hypothetical protein